MGTDKYPQCQLVYLKEKVAQVSVSTPCLPNSKEKQTKIKDHEHGYNR